LPPLPRPRSYDESPIKDSGATLSALKDTLRMIEVANSQVNYGYLDRWYISQLVYHAIRQNDYDGFRESFIRIDTHLWGVVDTLMHDYARRIFKPLSRTSAAFKLHFLFYLPDTNVTRQRRLKAGKTYPYPLASEHSYYELAYKSLPTSWRIGSAIIQNKAGAAAYIEDVKLEETQEVISHAG